MLIECYCKCVLYFDGGFDIRGSVRWYFFLFINFGLVYYFYIVSDVEYIVK